MDWAGKINWVDVLFLIIILRSTYVGSQTGFFAGLFNIIGTVLAIVIGMHFYSPAGDFLLKRLSIPLNISNLIAFIALAFLVYMLFRILETVIKKLIKVEVLPGLNKAIDKAGGPVIGFCKGLAASIFVFLVLLLIPSGYVVNSAKANSLSGDFFSQTSAVLYAKTIGMMPSTAPADINSLLAGAKPLEIKLPKPGKRDKLDEASN